MSTGGKIQKQFKIGDIVKVRYRSAVEERICGDAIILDIKYRYAVKGVFVTKYFIKCLNSDDCVGSAYDNDIAMHCDIMHINTEGGQLWCSQLIKHGNGCAHATLEEAKAALRF